MKEHVTEETPDGKAQQLLQLLASNFKKTKKDKCQSFYFEFQLAATFLCALVNTSRQSDDCSQLPYYLPLPQQSLTTQPGLHSKSQRASNIAGMLRSCGWGRPTGLHLTRTQAKVDPTGAGVELQVG